MPFKTDYIQTTAIAAFGVVAAYFDSTFSFLCAWKIYLFKHWQQGFKLSLI